MVATGYETTIEPLVFSEDINPSWQSQPGWNELYLRSQFNYLEDLLESNGYLFLNRVLQQLEFKEIPAGQRLGWFCGRDDDPKFEYEFVKQEDGSYLITLKGYTVIWDMI